MVFDEKEGVLLLYGGANASGNLADTWQWDGTRWTEIPSATNPGKRYQPIMVYDRKRQETVLYGGLGEIRTDTWLWRNGAWRNAATAAR